MDGPDGATVAAAPIRVAVGVTQCWHRVPGGTATSIVDLIGALGARPDDVDVVAVGPRSSTPPSPDLGAATIRRLPLPLPLLYDAWTALRRPTLTSAAGAVDLVHVTVPITPPRDRVPLVATVHDVLPLSHPEWFTGRGARLMRRGLRAIAERADVVVVPSRATERDCISHGFDASRMRVVPWGSAPPLPPPGGGATRPELGERYVLFVGTTEPRKGLRVLADALVELDRSDVSLVLAGPSGWGDADGGRLAAVPGPVHTLGYVDRAELVALERGAAAVCIPSLAEGFGLPVLESLAAGAVVVTTADTACGEVAGDAATLVPAGDAAALADALARLLDDPSASDDLRARGPARAAEFTWAATADGVIDAYRHALEVRS